MEKGRLPRLTKRSFLPTLRPPSEGGRHEILTSVYKLVKEEIDKKERM